MLKWHATTHEDMIHSKCYFLIHQSLPNQMVQVFFRWWLICWVEYGSCILKQTQTLRFFAVRLGMISTRPYCKLTWIGLAKYSKMDSSNPGCVSINPFQESNINFTTRLKRDDIIGFVLCRSKVFLREDFLIYRCD